MTDRWLTPTARTGSIHGFRVRSDVGFRGLRSDDGTLTELTIRPWATEPAEGSELQSWEPGGGRGRTVLRRVRDRALVVETQSAGRFAVDLDRNLIEVPPGPLSVVELLTFATPTALAIEATGSLALHAAGVQIGSTALILPAAGGSGKTTLAAAFQTAGHRALGDDLMRVDVSGSTPTVYPGSAIVRLRRDSVDHLGLANFDVIGEVGDKLHCAVPLGLRGSGAPLPLSGIVFVAQGPGRPRLTAVDAQVAIARLWKSAFFSPFDQARQACFERLADLVARVPAWELTRPLRFESLPDTVETITRAAVSP